MVSTTEKVILQCESYAFIPTGFLTNYASIPKALKFFLEDMGVYRDAFVIHDMMYAYGGYFTDKKLDGFVAVSQREADRELWYQMVKLGATKKRAELYYQAVKWFGGLSFRK